MKLKRRKTLYLLTSMFTLVGFKNSIQRAQAQSSPVIGVKKNSLAALDLRPDNTTYSSVIDYSLDGRVQLQKSSDQKVVLDNLGIGFKNNPEQIYQTFLQAAAGGIEDKPVLMYQGINTSPYSEQIKDYHTRLMQRPNGKNLVSGTQVNATFSPYPQIGKLPNINEQGLIFIHEDIKEACVCIGNFDNQGKFRTKWLGRNALACDEFWSSTKIIALLNLVSRINKKNPEVDFDSYSVRGIDTSGNQNSFRFQDLARDMVSYEQKIATSNSLGAMFKRFSLPLDLEKWLKLITGNQDLIFRDTYGEKPFIEQPELVETTTNKVVLNADQQLPRLQCNAVSAYDLTRIVSMLGWHNYIPRQSRLPYAEYSSLKTVITAMGADSARLTDLAIQVLGLQNDLESVAIISKLGNGNTSIRERTEAVYVALVHFVDSRPKALGKPAKLFTFTMALRGGKALQPRDPNREVIELDARMATEVTEIVRRVLALELDLV